MSMSRTFIFEVSGRSAARAPRPSPRTESETTTIDRRCIAISLEESRVGSGRIGILPIESQDEYTRGARESQSSGPGGGAGLTAETPRIVESFGGRRFRF